MRVVDDAAEEKRQRLGHENFAAPVDEDQQGRDEGGGTKDESETGNVVAADGVVPIVAQHVMPAQQIHRDRRLQYMYSHPIVETVPPCENAFAVYSLASVSGDVVVSVVVVVDDDLLVRCVRHRFVRRKRPSFAGESIPPSNHSREGRRRPTSKR